MKGKKKVSWKLMVNDDEGGDDESRNEEWRAKRHGKYIFNTKKSSFLTDCQRWCKECLVN